MLKTQLPHPRTLLIPAALAALIFSGQQPLRAEQPEMVEATLMFLLVNPDPADPADVLPSPAGEDAIGLVLDGGQDLGAGLTPESGFGPEWVSGSYAPTDATYIAKGGNFGFVAVYTKGFIWPPHGFINLRNSTITSYDSYAVKSGTTLQAETDPSSATHYVFFVDGCFELHSR